MLLVLDHLEDPQNIGTLLRTAEALGVHSVYLPDRRAASITPAVCNASSGAVEHLLITEVTNIARTQQEPSNRVCGSSGWMIGLRPKS